MMDLRDEKYEIYLSPNKYYFLLSKDLTLVYLKSDILEHSKV